MEDQSAPQPPTPGQPNGQQIKPIDQAIRLIQQAVEQDRNANFVLAFRLYMQSLEYFMLAYEHEQNPSAKKFIGDKMSEYMTHAGNLKAFLESQGQI
ncbi:Vacuolar protein sorting-associated protein 4B [Aphanomyces cochlioides]|nr:Vacuolar protein sorting-associated protein 4B [Aphanomyces cochlioides]